MAQRSCCVPGCRVKLGDGVPLHNFPNPNNPAHTERFRTWMIKIGKDIVGEDNDFIYRNRKVCHKHFEDVYTFPNNKLTALAIPTLQISGVHMQAASMLKDNPKELPSTSGIIDTYISSNAGHHNYQVKMPMLIKQNIDLQSTSRRTNIYISKTENGILPT